MSGEPPHYEIDPNRIRVRGREELEAIALSATVDASGVQVTVRTGAVSSREIQLSYADISSVETTEELTYGLVLVTDDSEYTITNVTANDEEFAEIVSFVRDRIRRHDSGQGNRTASGSSDPAGDTSAQSGAANAAELQKWVELNEQGVISDAELEEKKRELL